MRTRHSLRFLLLGAALLFTVSCSGDDTPSPGGTTTTTALAAADDGGPTQDLWVLHELRGVAEDGEVLDVLEGVEALAADASGDPVELVGGATFTPSDALGAHLRSMDGDERDGISVIGGMLRNGERAVPAILATPDDGGHWPGAEDLVSFNVPDADHGMPLVATIELVQLLPGPVPENGAATDDLELMMHRIQAGSYQYAATDAGDALVYSGQVGTMFSPAGATMLTPGADEADLDDRDADDRDADGRDADDPDADEPDADASAVDEEARAGATVQRVSFTGRSTPPAQSASVKPGGIPAKAAPLIDSIGDGLAGCDGLGLECVKDLLDSIEGGASASNDLLNGNFPPPPPPSPPAPPPRPANYCKPTCADTDGEPHLVTFDGLRYDVQLVGEFVLARNEDVEVQVRTVPYSTSRFIAVNAAVVVGVADHVIEISRGTKGEVLVDGERIELDISTGSEHVVGDDIVVVRRPRSIDVVREDQLVLTVRVGTGLLGISVPGGETGSPWEGLFGDNDGDEANDLRSRDGDVIADEDVEDFYDLHTTTWRISDEESLFTYDEGESTETFTDLTFPDARITAATLTPEERARAEAVCQLAGIDPGPPMDACVMDFALTGDIKMVHAAQAQRAVLRALAMENPGDLSEAAGASGGGTTEALGERLVSLRGNGPAVGDGLVLLRTEDEDGRAQLRAVESDSGAVRWQVPDVSHTCRPVVVPGIGVAAPMYIDDESVTTPVVLLDLDDGSELARFEPQEEDPPVHQCDVVLEAAGETVLYLNSQVLIALDAGNDLAPLWSREIERPAAAVSAGGSIVVAFRPTDNSTAVELLDPDTGDTLNTLDLSGARFASAPGVLHDLGDGIVAVLTAEHGDEPAALSVLDVDGADVKLRWELVADEDSPVEGSFMQVARSGDVLAGLSRGERAIIGFDLANGEVLWRHGASSFDNSAGQIVGFGDRGFAITPFGGDWIEAVNVDGEQYPTITPPNEQMVAPLLTPLPDGRIAVIGRLEGGDVGGAFVTIVSIG